MKKALLIAGLSLLATPVLAQAKFPVAADGTTNVVDCLKAPVEARNDCISRARPMNNKALMEFTKSREAAVKSAPAPAAPAKAAAVKPVDKKAAKAAEARFHKARVASAPKGLKVGADGLTDIRQCGSVGPALFNECLSRARPMKSKELAAYTKQRTVAEAKKAAKKAAATKTATKPASAKTADKKAEPKAVAAPAPVKILDVKGFVIAKDGTTNIADCAKAKPEFKNECISRARPVTGAQIYGKSSKTGKGG